MLIGAWRRSSASHCSLPWPDPWSPASAATRPLPAPSPRGDLTQLLEPKGSDELAELAVHLNRMVEAQSSASGQMSEGATTLSSSTAEMLVTVNQNTAAASEQSAAIQEVSATVEELRATAEQAAATAEDVAAKSQARRMGSGRHSTPSRTSSAAWATSP